MTRVPGQARRVSIIGTANAPAWFINATPLTWVTPASNVIDDVASGSADDICDAWTGAWADPVNKHYGFHCAGGHQAPAGPATYRIDLTQETPAWEQVAPVTGSPGESGYDNLNGTNRALDGTMHSVHGWHDCIFAAGKIWHGKLSGMDSGNWSTAIWSFDYAGVLAGTYGSLPLASPGSAHAYHGKGVASPNQSSVSFESGPVAYDETGGKIWVAAEGASNDGSSDTVYAFNASTGAKTNGYVIALGGTPYHYSWSVAPQLKADGNPFTKRCWIIMSSAPRDNNFTVMDFGNPGVFAAVSPSGSPQGHIEGSGAVYHQASQAILVWDDSFGADLRKVTVPDDPTQPGYVWSSVSVGGVTPGPYNSSGLGGPYQGCYGKLQIIPNFDGAGADLLVNVTDNAGPVLCCKLPAGGV